MISKNQIVKTTTPIHKLLLDEIDHVNPFKTRREFFEEACRQYLREIKRKLVYQKLEEACRESTHEDLLDHADWDCVTLEGWK
jgi:metal-responsive CopG/Arc/MetJ family transcriptional regulator